MSRLAELANTAAKAALRKGEMQPAETQRAIDTIRHWSKPSSPMARAVSSIRHGEITLTLFHKKRADERSREGRLIGQRRAVAEARLRNSDGSIDGIRFESLTRTWPCRGPEM